MKKIGFLSFGHWTPSPQSQTRSAGDALLQSIDLAVAAEELGADGAYFRVHHFARQLAAPFPLLAAVGAQFLGGDGQVDRLQQGIPRRTRLRLRRRRPMAKGQKTDLFHGKAWGGRNRS